MIGFEPSLFVSESEPHKTYTLTWKHSPFFGRCVKRTSVLSRCRFDRDCFYWPPRAYPLDVIGAFVFALGEYNKAFRLTCCGRLVARSATYQGV